MKIDNPFDRKLTLWKGRIPSLTHDAAVYVHDTLELAQAAAESIFGDKATPEVTLAIYSLFMEYIQTERLSEEIDNQ